MEITAMMVKELRAKSGAGIMECKGALKEADGDIEEAVTVLRKKGLAKAGKVMGREAGDGAIGSYIHPGNKIGVMLQLHCETDFVANTEDFQGLLRDICMHIAASKSRYASRDEVTQEDLDKEREIFAHQAKESGKPENIIDKIVEGKMEKFYEENCLLDQPYIKETSLTVGEMIKQRIAIFGENITVGKFSRFEISK
ncbi:MAG: translation elongation factor Ts [Nitrospinae bacterium]|jgi:elongation factor Ts|nr:translation elongation factor Ts [Nitrospinota bacterium]MDA1108900.1 translation elongation factor Ts [Nitrospinota bacterium]